MATTRDPVEPAFLSLCHRVELTAEVINQTVTICRQYHLEIPDAIIAASTLHLGAPLVSADTDFQKLGDLVLIADILGHRKK